MRAASCHLKHISNSIGRVRTSISFSPATPPRTSARLPSTRPGTLLLVRLRLVEPYLSLSKCTRQERLAWEISTQNHRPHIAMSYDPTIAWKASPTRTPPPICTSAPFP